MSYQPLNIHAGTLIVTKVGVHGLDFIFPNGLAQPMPLVGMSVHSILLVGSCVHFFNSFPTTNCFVLNCDALVGNPFLQSFMAR